MNEVLELVSLHEAGRKDFDGDSHILVLDHGSVEVFDVDHHEFCIGSRQDAVEEELGCFNHGGGNANTNVAWVPSEKRMLAILIMRWKCRHRLVLN
jgi:hypothetical protein